MNRELKKLAVDVDPVVFAENIRAIRRQKCLTQQDIADKMNTYKANISKYESGRMKRIKPDKVLAFANALDVPISCLIDLSGTTTESDEYINIADYTGTNYIQIPRIFISDYLQAHQLFYVLVKSDTAKMYVAKDDYVIVSKIETVRHKDLVLATDGNVYKYYYVNTGSHVLYTTKGDTTSFEQGIHDLDIIGKVITTIKRW